MLALQQGESLIELTVASAKSAGKPDEAVHASFSGHVAREMGKAEALLKVIGSRPENLVDNFFTLMPSGSPADFQRILELKVARFPAQMVQCCQKLLCNQLPIG